MTLPFGVVLALYLVGFWCVLLMLGVAVGNLLRSCRKGDEAATDERKARLEGSRHMVAEAALNANARAFAAPTPEHEAQAEHAWASLALVDAVIAEDQEAIQRAVREQSRAERALIVACTPKPVRVPIVEMLAGEGGKPWQ